MKTSHSVLRECRKTLARLYGKRLKGLVLYGSSARGRATAESDIDLLVLLEGPVNVSHEIHRIWQVLYPVQLRSDRVISVMPADASAYGKGSYALYANVQRHGIPV